MVLVSVKWQKQLFENIEIDTNEPPLLFKGQLYALSGVPPDRQKIMVKGGLLQDDGDWSKLGIKEGQRLMMMGTAEAVPEPPKETNIQFIEDLPEQDREGAMNKDFSAGLVNLGNTCYMNSTLQCLHSIPELNTSLSLYENSSSSSSSSNSQDASHRLALETKKLFSEMDKSWRPVSPFRFLMLLREKFPQFSQTGQNGMYMQQDAEECFTQLIYSLSQQLKDPITSDAIIKKLFGTELQNSMKCNESGEENMEKETMYTMKCHISSDINQLGEGLKAGLKGEIEKMSPLLGRTSIFTKSSLITRLPKYMTIQFVRFFWKRESQQKAKILRKVSYPLVLDMYEYCTDELKEKLNTPRKSLLLEDNKKFGHDPKKQKSESSTLNLNDESAKAKDVIMDDVASNSLPDSLPADNSIEMFDESKTTGFYELNSVLTHKGRSADSGHYVGWVKQSNGSWIEFDDEQPILRKEEEIVNLSGGGDWHMAYILIYKARLAP